LGTCSQANLKMKIEQVYIGCCRIDERFTRALVASVRFWYPEIPISLLKDNHKGYFDTSDIENKWNVSVARIKKNLAGLQKMEAMFFYLKNAAYALIQI
ncbi:MAG: hypothetical protein JW946_02860, partial [Candidatus Omnitrophica bacterium]|nr:hypothetical protein [Candidatus Omnitrophota bacterium]